MLLGHPEFGLHTGIGGGVNSIYVVYYGEIRRTEISDFFTVHIFGYCK